MSNAATCGHTVVAMNSIIPVNLGRRCNIKKAIISNIFYQFKIVDKIRVDIVMTYKGMKLEANV